MDNARQTSCQRSAESKVTPRLTARPGSTVNPLPADTTQRSSVTIESPGPGRYAIPTTEPAVGLESDTTTFPRPGRGRRKEHQALASKRQEPPASVGFHLPDCATASTQSASASGVHFSRMQQIIEWDRVCSRSVFTAPELLDQALANHLRQRHADLVGKVLTCRLIAGLGDRGGNVAGAQRGTR